MKSKNKVMRGHLDRISLYRFIFYIKIYLILNFLPGKVHFRVYNGLLQQANNVHNEICDHTGHQSRVKISSATSRLQDNSNKDLIVSKFQYIFQSLHQKNQGKASK